MKSERADLRKEEIINACEKLYGTNHFKDITIKMISEKTSFSRPSIYNYFETKEEIFLALFEREYQKWIKELNHILTENEAMTKEKFSSELAHSIEKRKKLLRLLSMNMYDMEENSRLERLVDFKRSYGKAIKTVKEILNHFFPHMKEQEVNAFLFSFFPFMYGLYPYTHVTDKQKKAMEEAGVEYQYYSLYDLAYQGILKLLNVDRKEEGR